MGEDLLLWCDLEMTGLDPDRHVIVELALVATTADLEVVDEGIDLVVHQDDEALATMDDFVRTMHTKSGLLEAIRTSTVSLTDAGDAALQYLRARVGEGTAPLCGNSIGMDRRFLARYLPAVDGYLHYRSIDVSTVKELARRWYPDVFRQRPDKREGHRALADIRESIEELRYYRDTVFRERTGPSSSGSLGGPSADAP
jgi:oligoribonuclease